MLSKIYNSRKGEKESKMSIFLALLIWLVKKLYLRYDIRNVFRVPAGPPARDLSPWNSQSLYA